MTVVRDYANLAPVRYQRPVAHIIWILAVAMLIAIAAHHLLGLGQPWLDCGQSLFFMALGANWFLWPNSPVSNPFATRLLGGLLFATGLWMLIEFASHHLI